MDQNPRIGSPSAGHSSVPARLGALLILAGLAVFFPLNQYLTYQHVASKDDRLLEHNTEIMKIPFIELMSRLDQFSERDARRIMGGLSGCSSPETFGTEAEEFVIAPDGGLVCGSPPEVVNPTDGWVSVDGKLVHTLEARDGSMVGVVVEPNSLLPGGWGETTLDIQVVAGGSVLASTDPGSVTVGGRYERAPGQIVKRVPGTDIYLVVGPYSALSDDRGWFVLLIGTAAFLLVPAGLFLRVVIPFRRVWREQGAPDEAQMLLIDRHGVIRSESHHHRWSGRRTHFRERFVPDDRQKVDDLFARSQNGDAAVVAVFGVNDGQRVRVVVFSWVPLLRRYLVLVTRYIADPISEAVADPINRSHAVIINKDASVLYIGAKCLTMFGTGALVIGQNFHELLEPAELERFRATRTVAQSRPYLVLPVQLRHRWGLYSCLMISDEHSRTYLWFEDDTAALLGKTTRAFVSELCSYLQQAGSSRPDLARLRKNLRLDETDETDNEPDHQREAAQALVGELRTLVRFADRDRLVASTGSELRLSTARRREFARRLHDDVVQDLVALRWRDGLDEQAQLLHDRVLLATRAIMDDLRVPPWEQRATDLLAGLLHQVRLQGISVVLNVQTPEPVPFELISIIGVVAKEALSNSVKHAHPNEITVDLRMVGPQQLILTVTDDGSGTGAEDSGVGYGLRMCDELAKEYGGSFVLISGENGHTARLLLPLEDSSGDTADAVPLRPGAPEWVET